MFNLSLVGYITAKNNVQSVSSGLHHGYEQSSICLLFTLLASHQTTNHLHTTKSTWYKPTQNNNNNKTHKHQTQHFRRISTLREMIDAIPGNMPLFRGQSLSEPGSWPGGGLSGWEYVERDRTFEGFGVTTTSRFLASDFPLLVLVPFPFFSPFTWNDLPLPLLRSGELRTQKLKSQLMRTQSLKVLPLKPGVGQYI